MQTILNSPSAPAHDALVEKKSEFIGDAAHVDDLDEALAFVASIREQHPKARHVAYAAVCGGADGRLSERMSDDGEPSGTAGKPILDVLKQSGTTDCVVAVTRYFGGILLGSGGLVRAYSSAASLALKSAQVARIMTARQYLVHLEYPQLARFQQLLGQLGATQENESYTMNVQLTAVVPADQCDRFEERVREMFNAAVVPEPGAMVNIPVPIGQ
ncbi:MULTISPECIES: IMPACT family protein [Bifidobacterium]|uniref:IMPACT family protein n=2 Tax=Bifidobacterium TaxID=1678 RepID=A0A2M9HRT6_9BIFI|nr:MULTISPECIES: YigZ family protein [Bifidobacterium]NMM97098.1 IMPACT family member YigZ [Bifidobacterium sp. DSM 109959]PJM79479.1 IMPACT family protein [Bifidobacterium scaligerum]